MPKIIVDGKEIEAKEAKNCLEALLENNIDLPYFCYHPALGAVGSCRLCAIKTYKDEMDAKGRMAMACMEPVAEGKRISIKDQEVNTFRKWIIEWAMVSHPHDCPICDEGGECHLQDMTVMTGHRSRRYRGKKTTHNNQYLGPFINHEMNRCIQCYRCVRYYQNYAGGHDLIVMMSRSRVYFGRRADGVLESPFAGNLIDVCPTGVFTDKTQKKHYIRKWNQETAPSICTQCGMGCNTIPGACYGKLRRITPRYNEDVNGYFICDRGRFGYQYNNAQTRLREPLAMDNGIHRITDRKKAWQKIKMFCQMDKVVAGIGSPRASLEANYALQKLVGEQNFSIGVSGEDHELIIEGLDVYQRCSAPTPTVKEVEQSDCILVLGADVTHEIPRQDLAIRQSVKNGATLWILSSRGTALDGVAKERQPRTPSELIKSTTQILNNLSRPSQSDSFEGRVAQTLNQAKKPLIIVGWYHGLAKLFRMAGSMVQALQDQQKEARLLIAFPEANTVGVGLLGGVSFDVILKRIENGDIERLIVLENDLLHRTSDSQRLQKALKKLNRFLLLDHTETVTTSLATDVIPIATTVESNGTWVNAEGRAGRSYQVYLPDPFVPDAWEVLRDLPNSEGMAKNDVWKTPDDVLRDLGMEKPLFKPTVDIAPPANFRQNGQKIPRQSHRASGRMANPSIKDVRQHLKPPEDSDTPFCFSMEGSHNVVPWSLIPRYWTPNWNSQEAVSKFQAELGLGLHGGACGQRLIEPNGGKALQESQTKTEQEEISINKGEILLVPSAEIFGSEPFSRLSEAIEELVPKPYLDLHPDTAGELTLKEGATHTVSWPGQSADLIVRFNLSLPKGTGIVPARFQETQHMQVPSVGRIGGKTS